MVYLDLSPYHENLMKYWKPNRDNHLDQDFWSWVKKEYGAEVYRNQRPELWKFENEQDAMWFALRWS